MRVLVFLKPKSYNRVSNAARIISSTGPQRQGVISRKPGDNFTMTIAPKVKTTGGLFLFALVFAAMVQAIDTGSALSNGNTADGSRVLLSLTTGIAMLRARPASARSSC